VELRELPFITGKENREGEPMNETTFSKDYPVGVSGPTGKCDRAGRFRRIAAMCSSGQRKSSAVTCSMSRCVKHHLVIPP